MSELAQAALALGSILVALAFMACAGSETEADGER